MKTICIFSSLYLPHVGGVEKYTNGLAEELSKRGNRVIIITCNTEKIEQASKENGIEVIRIPCVSLIQGRYPIPRLFQLHKIFKLLKNIQIDNIIINNRFYILSLLAARFSYRQGVHNLLIEHGSQYLTLNNVFLDKIIQLYEHSITKLIKRYINQFVGVGNASAKWLSTFNIKSNKVLYNAVMPVSFVGKKNNEVITITYIGRLLKEKGVLDILEVYGEVQSMGYKVKLVVGGEGPVEKQVKETALRVKNIEYLGKLTSLEVQEALRKTDIFLLPTRSEGGLATALLEAGMQGCAIIASDIPANKEIIDNGENGVLVKYNSNVELKQAIIELIKSPDIRKKYGECIRNKVMNMFSWNITVNELERMLSELQQK